ncbi:hypothetical protein GYMLUDRAFT_426391 [Collybiopsis luxurians FD-317 M1]|uniref:Uncharacterized protein n=1 Tax=Collybiopsis luxurians FD-317 M1 TaxID=944289 RepID=A0A0D0CLX8_9AGAR|nr:hypothetical protein GYMLUDRAFT_426391 [Collybiopsis luxurians FD-317 M1]
MYPFLMDRARTRCTILIDQGEKRGGGYMRLCSRHGRQNKGDNGYRYIGGNLGGGVLMTAGRCTLKSTERFETEGRKRIDIRRYPILGTPVEAGRAVKKENKLILGLEATSRSRRDTRIYFAREDRMLHTAHPQPCLMLLMALPRREWTESYHVTILVASTKAAV